LTQRHANTSKTELLAGSWRVDVNGWIFVHVHGDPYRLGFQNGHLLAHEIQDTIEADRLYVEGAYKREWDFFCDTSMNLYWPKLLEEYRAEIEGIADGVKAEGISEVSLDDIVALNGFDDSVSYHYWLKNREGQSAAPAGREEHCSAFIATGKATSDGKILIAHNTWSSYMIAKCNIIVDVSPVRGKGFLMQANPGSLSSGTDWFLCKSGLLITETTISGVITFNPNGTPYFIRARKAAQYADTINDWVKIMLDDNNGGYANDWLVGDMKTGEIARLELGTFNHAMDRTFDGVFVGSNMATSEQVRSETKFNYDDESGSCAARYRRWAQLIEPNRTPVNVEMAKEFLADHHDAYSGKDTPNSNTLCGHVELDDRGVPEWGLGPYYPTGAYDGKVTDSNLASGGAFWGHWGKPCDNDFNASSFLSQHQEYSWQQSRLRDIRAYPWTLFKAASKWEIG
jgi:Phospholipase B